MRVLPPLARAAALWSRRSCFGYLPTASVVKEGGHEAIGITLWAWGRDLDRYVAFFAPEVQDVVVDTVKELATKAGRDR